MTIFKKQKASVLFVSLKVLEATFCVGVKTKRPTRNSGVYPCEGALSLLPQTKKSYGGTALMKLVNLLIFTFITLIKIQCNAAGCK